MVVYYNAVPLILYHLWIIMSQNHYLSSPLKMGTRSAMSSKELRTSPLFLTPISILIYDWNTFTGWYKAISSGTGCLVPLLSLWDPCSTLEFHPPPSFCVVFLEAAVACSLIMLQAAEEPEGPHHLTSVLASKYTPAHHVFFGQL